MKRLIINNFGAIKKADIVIKKYNIYTGDTSCGKSTVAKLIAIGNSSAFTKIDTSTFSGSHCFHWFEKLLKNYNIDFQFDDSTLIQYENEGFYWEIRKDNFITNSPDNTSGIDFSEHLDMRNDEFQKKIMHPRIEKVIDGNDNSKRAYFEQSSVYKIRVVYIPTERILMSLYTNSVFSFLSANLPIPECITVFGALYEKAKIQNNRIDIDMLNIRVSFSSEGDTISLKGSNKDIGFSQASSGMQSVIPLWTVFNHHTQTDEERFFAIEEPELNLFPTTQLHLTQWIMSKIRNSKRSSIVITTHSPYILAAVENLVFAGEIYKQKDTHPEIIDKLDKLELSTSMIDFDEVSSYFFHSTGEVKNIVNNEFKTIGAEHIDKASNISGELFDELCDLENKYLS
jgi:predicted ATPase